MGLLEVFLISCATSSRAARSSAALGGADTPARTCGESDPAKGVTQIRSSGSCWCQRQGHRP